MLVTPAARERHAPSKPGQTKDTPSNLLIPLQEAQSRVRLPEEYARHRGPPSAGLIVTATGHIFPFNPAWIDHQSTQLLVESPPAPPVAWRTRTLAMRAETPIRRDACAAHRSAGRYGARRGPAALSMRDLPSVHSRPRSECKRTWLGASPSRREWAYAIRRFRRLRTAATLARMLAIVRQGAPPAPAESRSRDKALAPE